MLTPGAATVRLARFGLPSFDSAGAHDAVRCGWYWSKPEAVSGEGCELEDCGWGEEAVQPMEPAGARSVVRRCTARQAHRSKAHVCDPRCLINRRMLPDVHSVAEKANAQLLSQCYDMRGTSSRLQEVHMARRLAELGLGPGVLDAFAVKHEHGVDAVLVEEGLPLLAAALSPPDCLGTPPVWAPNVAEALLAAVLALHNEAGIAHGDLCGPDSLLVLVDPYAGEEDPCGGVRVLFRNLRWADWVNPALRHKDRMDAVAVCKRILLAQECVDHPIFDMFP